jgi:hypothetical protein
MQSSIGQIEKEIRRKRRGRIYFASDFVAFGSPDAVKKSLSRLEKSGFLVRIAFGIYLYPNIDKKFGIGILYPSVEDIAKEIAERDKARIVPTGIYALNALGLSTQVPMNAVFLTDGAPRKIKIYKQKIVFKHVTPKNLAYRSNVLMLVVAAIKEIGKGNLSASELEKLKSVLSYETKENILLDLELAPAWIKKIILSII